MSTCYIWQICIAKKVISIRRWIFFLKWMEREEVPIQNLGERSGGEIGGYFSYKTRLFFYFNKCEGNLENILKIFTGLQHIVIVFFIIPVDNNIISCLCKFLKLMENIEETL